MDFLQKLKTIFYSFRGLAIISLADIIGNAISAFFWLYLASLLGDSNYGQVAYLLAIGGIASTVASIGATTTIIVYSAKNIKLEGSLYFLSILATICTAVMIFFIIDNSMSLSIYVLGSVVFGLASAELLGKKLYKNYAKTIIGQKLLMVIFSLLFYNLFDLNGIILGFGISFLPYLSLIYKQFIGLRIDFSILRSHFTFIITNYILGLASIASNSIDKLIISYLFGYALLGNYQLAVQFLTILQMLPMIVYKYTLPHDAGGNPNVMLKRTTIIISSGLAVLFIVLSPFAIPVFFPKFTMVIELVQIISVAIIPISINYAYISEFFGKEKNKIILLSSGLSFVLQSILIVTLGSIIGVKGIALSYVIVISVQAGFVMFMRNRMLLADN